MPPSPRSEPIDYPDDRYPARAITPSPWRGVIVMLDALGMKGAWARTDPGMLIERWTRVTKLFRKAISNVAAEAGLPIGSYQVVAFSDTVIITVETTEKVSGDETPNYRALLVAIGLAMVEPFYRAMIDSRILFRGIMTVGEYYQTKPNWEELAVTDDVLTIGPALDEAASWYELSDWIGLSVAPSSAFHLERGKLLELSQAVFVEHAIPMKGNTKLSGWAVDWPKFLLARYDDSRVTAEAELLKVFAAEPIDPVAVPKYNNTLAFCRKRFDELVPKSSPGGSEQAATVSAPVVQDEPVS